MQRKAGGPLFWPPDWELSGEGGLIWSWTSFHVQPGCVIVLDILSCTARMCHSLNLLKQTSVWLKVILVLWSLCGLAKGSAAAKSRASLHAVAYSETVFLIWAPFVTCKTQRVFKIIMSWFLLLKIFKIRFPLNLSLSSHIKINKPKNQVTSSTPCLQSPQPDSWLIT